MVYILNINTDFATQARHGAIITVLGVGWRGEKNTRCTIFFEYRFKQLSRLLR